MLEDLQPTQKLPPLQPFQQRGPTSCVRSNMRNTSMPLTGSRWICHLAPPPPPTFRVQGWRWTKRRGWSSSIHPRTWYTEIAARSSPYDPHTCLCCWGFCHAVPSSCCLRGTISTLQPHYEEIPAAHSNPGVLVSEGTPLNPPLLGVPTVTIT